MNTPVVSTKSMSEAVMHARAAEVRAEHDAVEHSLKAAVGHALRAGKLLLDVKTEMPHGTFGYWLEKYARLKPRTAQAYMQLARVLPELPKADAQRVADLSLRAALAELPRLTGKIAKLPPPAAARVLKSGRASWRDLKAAVSREATNSQVIEAQREPRTKTWVTSDPAEEPAALPPSLLVEALLEVCRQHRNRHPETGDAEVLEALNEAYCRIQSEAVG